MPAARPHDERRPLLARRVALAGLRLDVGQFSGPVILEIDLAFDQVRPGRRGGVLEIGHIDVGAGIECVDHHLAVDRPGELDAAVLQILGDRRDLPVAVAHLLRLGKEIGQLAGVEAPLPLAPAREQALPRGVEAAVQVGDEGKRVAGEDFVVTRAGRAAHDDALHARKRAVGGSPDKRTARRPRRRPARSACPGLPALGLPFGFLGFFRHADQPTRILAQA